MKLNIYNFKHSKLTNITDFNLNSLVQFLIINENNDFFKKTGKFLTIGLDKNNRLLIFNR